MLVSFATSSNLQGEMVPLNLSENASNAAISSLKKWDLREGFYLGAPGPSEKSLSRLSCSILLGFGGFGGVLSCFTKWDRRQGANFCGGAGWPIDLEPGKSGD